MYTNLSNESSGQDAGSGGAISSGVIGPGGSLADKLGADVLNWVVQLDLLGDCDTVIHNLGRAILGLKDDVAALKWYSMSQLHGVIM